MNRLNNQADKLIEIYLEIELIFNEEPTVTKIFPRNFDDGDVKKIIPQFCYPNDNIKEKSYSPLSCFSFVLTSESYRQFGFVRKELDSNKSIVLVSYWPWHDIFFKLMNQLADMRKKVTEKEFDNLLSRIMKKPIPNEESYGHFTFSDANAVVLREFSFKRPSSRELPSIPESHNLSLFFNFIDPEAMINIFAALLAERRIIFKSSNLEKLSACLQASCCLLYPMTWQHIYIPILPFKLKEYLTAPMPYCIGCPEAVFKTVRREELENVVIVDCDTSKVESQFNDVSEMPNEIVSFLRKKLSKSPAELRGDGISRIFLSALVQIIGGYRDAIKYPGNKLKFDNDTFIDSQPSSHRNFAQKIVELQIFQQFIEERLKLTESGSELTDIFEIEVELQAEKGGKKFTKYKDFIKNLGSKTNPSVKSAVKSVKAMGKELKLKIKDSNRSHDRVVDYTNSNTYLRKDRTVSEPFTSYNPTASSTFIESPSASSSNSSSSDMNILPELQSLPIFQLSNNESRISTSTNNSQSQKDESNLIDLSSSLDSFQFDPLMNGDRKVVEPPPPPTKDSRKVKGNSLIGEIVAELNKSSSTSTRTSLNRSNWETFDS